MKCPNETTNETDINTQGERPKISILAIGKIAAAVIIFLLITAIFWPGFIRLREYRRRIRCGENLVSLGKAMVIYACDWDDKYPTANKWCDLLTKYAEVSQKGFVCPSAGEGRCHYAMNPNGELSSLPDVVLLFETKGGWNQFGGPEILTFENHEGKGCNVWSNDFHVEFVKLERLGELKWKVKESK